MLPDQRFTIGRDSKVKSDTEKLLSGVLLDLFNELREHGLDAKQCKFLGDNDILIFRHPDCLMVVFSRDTRGVRMTLSEFDEDKALLTQKVEEPVLLTPPDSLRQFLDSLEMVQPEVIAVPIDQIAFSEEQLGEVTKQIARLLMEPTREDIDRASRVVRANPIFHGRDFTIDPELVFVLMEFQPPYTQIFDNLIKPAVEHEGFRIIKSDDIYSTSPVIEDIWENINRASLIIAEISTQNPNVMYELGICHTVGKEVMLLTQDTENIPFNFRHMRVYPYDNDIAGSRELERNISSVLQQISVST